MLQLIELSGGIIVKNKKIYFLMLLVCTLLLSVAVSAEDVFTISLEDSNGETSYKPGDTVLIDFVAKNMPPIDGFEFYLDYDDEVFLDVKATQTEFAEVFDMFSYLSNANVTHHFTGVSFMGDTTEGDGVLGQFEFKIADQVENGKYTIGFNTAEKNSAGHSGMVDGKWVSVDYYPDDGTMVLVPCTIQIGEVDESDEPESPSEDNPSVPEVKTGYTADFTTAEQSVDPGDEVTTTVTVGVGTEESVSTYNAAQMTFSYDPAVLTYAGYTSDVSDITVDETTLGTISLIRYGSDVALGDAVTLKFTTTTDATGSTEVKLNSANIDINANSSVQDAPAATITTGTHTIKFNETQTFTVTLDGEDVTGPETATEGQPYTFIVDKKEGYTYTVSATVNGTDISTEMTVSEEGKEYTIPGSVVSGDIVVTVTKTEIKPTINVDKNDDIVSGGGTVTQGEDYTFTINKEEGKEYVVTVTDADGNPVPYTENEDGSYTVKAEDIPASGLKIEVTEKEPESDLEVSVSEYLKLDGTTMWLVLAQGSLKEGNTGFAYNGAPMFESPEYDAFCYLVISDQGQDAVEETAKTAIVETAEAITALAYDKDVNRTGKVDINDAQMTYNMYNAYYGEFGAATMRMFLEADVTGDKTVDVADATAIVSVIK